MSTVEGQDFPGANTISMDFPGASVKDTDFPGVIQYFHGFSGGVLLKIWKP